MIPVLAVGSVHVKCVIRAGMETVGLLLWGIKKSKLGKCNLWNLMTIPPAPDFRKLCHVRWGQTPHLWWHSWALTITSPRQEIEIWSIEIWHILEKPPLRLKARTFVFASPWHKSWREWRWWLLFHNEPLTAQTFQVLPGFFFQGRQPRTYVQPLFGSNCCPN